MTKLLKQTLGKTINAPSFIDVLIKNCCDNGLKAANFSDFLEHIVFLKFHVHFLQGIMGKISVLLLTIIFNPYVLRSAHNGCLVPTHVMFYKQLTVSVDFSLKKRK